MSAPDLPATPANTPIAAPVISAGISTYLGVAVSVLSGVAAVVAGAEGNDVATATGGAVAVLAALTTIGGRMAQAIAVIRTAAQVASPWVDAAQAALAREPVDTVPPVVELDFEDGP